MATRAPEGFDERRGGEGRTVTAGRGRPRRKNRLPKKLPKNRRKSALPKSCQRPESTADDAKAARRKNRPPKNAPPKNRPTKKAAAPGDGEEEKRRQSAAPPNRQRLARRRRERQSDATRVVHARARYVRTSARKARMVCGHLRGKSSRRHALSSPSRLVRWHGTGASCWSRRWQTPRATTNCSRTI